MDFDKIKLTTAQLELLREFPEEYAPITITADVQTLHDCGFVEYHPSSFHYKKSLQGKLYLAWLDGKIAQEAKEDKRWRESRRLSIIAIVISILAIAATIYTSQYNNANIYNYYYYGTDNGQFGGTIQESVASGGVDGAIIVPDPLPPSAEPSP